MVHLRDAFSIFRVTLLASAAGSKGYEERVCKLSNLGMAQITPYKSSRSIWARRPPPHRPLAMCKFMACESGDLGKGGGMPAERVLCDELGRCVSKALRRKGA